MTVLDTIERLLNDAGHPDVVEVSRYPHHGEQAVKIRYRDQAQAFIWPEQGKRTRPAGQDDLGPYAARAGHVIDLLVKLLDIAQPEGWRWRTVAVEGVHREPAGIEVSAGGATVLLRVTSGASTLAEEAQSDPASWADWEPPASIT